MASEQISNFSGKPPPATEPPSSLAEGLPPDVAAQFQTLRQRFLSGLPDRWQEIEHAGTTAALRSALHRLAGSAGSYGFDSLGQLARRAELLAEAGAVDDLALVLAALAQHIQKLQEA